MKSLTWFAFTFIFIFSAIYVFNHESYSTRVQIINGYPVNFSVNRGQDLEFYLNPQADHKKGIVCIYDVNHQVVDSLTLDLKKQALSNDTMLYQHGYHYSNKYTYNTAQLKSGLYFMGNVVPFIVKEPQLKKSITVVFPFANYMALLNEGGKSFQTWNSSHGLAAETLSLHRPATNLNELFPFLVWLDKAVKSNHVNYISDLDLEQSDALKESELLILYGYQSFWTLKERETMDDFLNRGGRLLALCSNLMSSKMTYLKAQHQLSFIIPKGVPDSLLNAHNASRWSQFNPNTSTVGCNYELAYTVNKMRESNGAYVIINKKHPIFNGIAVDSIKMNTQNGNAIAVVSYDFKVIPEPDRSKNNFMVQEILAFDYGQMDNKQLVTGIFNFKKTTQSGEIIILGNEKWAAPENLDNEIISKIITNCIDYLYLPRSPEKPLN